jgi:hypothetical protein
VNSITIFPPKLCIKENVQNSKIDHKAFKNCMLYIVLCHSGMVRLQLDAEAGNKNCKKIKTKV